jgi:hypothetical protein
MGFSTPPIAAGFQFDGRRIPLINPQRGIFKPKEMASLLAGDEMVEYAFMGTDPTSADNEMGWIVLRSILLMADLMAPL